MPVAVTKIETRWTKQKQITRENYGFELGRNEYMVLSILMQDMIRQRVVEYHLDAYGYPFQEYSWRTAEKKDEPPVDAPWEKTRQIIGQLGRRLAKATGNKKAEQAIKAGIGHLWKLFDQQREEFYKNDKVGRSAVNLYGNTHDEHMMDTLKQDGTKQFARVKAMAYYAKWIQRGVNHDRKDKTGRPNGKLPARPFIGLTDAEIRFLQKNFLDPFAEWYLDALTAIALGEAPPKRPNPAAIGRQALHKKPTKNQEAQSGGR